MPEKMPSSGRASRADHRFVDGTSGRALSAVGIPSLSAIRQFRSVANEATFSASFLSKDLYQICPEDRP